METPSRSRGRPPMPLDRIIATAMRILDEDGVDALSMRTLADRLGSGTATLYRHVDGRGELVAHVVDAVMGEIAVSDDEFGELPWQQAMEVAARHMFDVLKRHPNVARLMIEHTPVGPNALALRERALRTLLDSGFAPPLAVRAWATLARYVLGFATQITPDPQPAPAAWSTFDAHRFPASLAVAEHVPLPLDDEFSFGLDMLIVGLTRLLDADPDQ